MSITEMFGTKTFDDRVMKSRLPASVYKSLRQTIDENAELDPKLADCVAAAMKDWAVENGATHFTHWFQPLTGITAEKHDSFISPAPDGGVIMEFSGKELIKGEPDASSLPSGGLRSTFEARGYTTWDPTSYAFIKEKTLCIPTAFCTYGGEALDKKTPLLRSMKALNKQAIRVLHAIGLTSVKNVFSSVGTEQEYFLIDKDMYKKRKDLLFTGRTLFGAKPPKGQEMDDHYFGAIKPRVAAYMKELNEELWKLGIYAKTEHNEVAPAQHELATIYTRVNAATDNNQLTMEVMQRIASKHGLVCLLAEKPFAGVNGSGKHNNWSVSTDEGVNLLAPGDKPAKNIPFLLFLSAIIKAVDDYQDLLRTSVASAGNDHRLGANEAPPAVVSIFLGSDISAVLESIENGSTYISEAGDEINLGVRTLPAFTRDTTDRNRTSPFAFTGNKFEFRMVGASDSVADANVMINASVAESLRQFADRLENASDVKAEINEIVKNTIKTHKRILFNGNGYDDSWIEEATTKRGLLNLKTTPDCIPTLLAEKNVDMLTRNKVFTRAELESRHEILFENYCKTLIIEASTMLEMARRDICPALEGYIGKLCDIASSKLSLLGEGSADSELRTLSILNKDLAAISCCADRMDALEKELCGKDVVKEAFAIRDELIPVMAEMRAAADDAERYVSSECWPFPTYADLLFGVN